MMFAKKTVLLSILTITSLAAVAFVAVSQSGASSLSMKEASGSTSYNLSFSRSDEYASSGTTYTYKKLTSSGNDVYLVSTDGKSRASAAIATVPSMFDSIAMPVLKFYQDSGASKLFRHQLISSISITTSANITLDIKTSADGIHYIDKGSIDCTSSGASFSTFDEFDRFVTITASSGAASAVSIKQVDVSYECDNSASSAFSSGTFSAVVKDKSDLDSPMSIIFNDDGYGYYMFFYNTDSQYQYTLFTWSYDQDLAVVTVTYTSTPAGSISDKTASGNTTTYQGYRLFSGFSAGKTNKVAIVGNSASVFMYTTNSESYIRSEATILTK